MRTAASRLPKGFSLEERLAACASNVESHPKDRAGQWRCWAPLGERRGDSYAAVVLDLGCGKGEYTVECAAARPDVLFVGLDVDGVCVMRAAERAIAQGVSNAVFVLHDDSDLSETFGEGELSAMLLNFPTPFPKKKKAHYRLTHFERLMSYRPLLAPGAFVRLRTDSSSRSRAMTCSGTPTMYEGCFPMSRGADTSISSWRRARPYAGLRRCRGLRRKTRSKPRHSRL